MSKDDTTEHEMPKVEFPCEYPVKVIVQQGDQVVTDIIAVLNTYDERISLETITQNPSSKGNYVSIRFYLWATGESQLQALFDELKQNSAVKMVL